VGENKPVQQFAGRLEIHANGAPHMVECIELVQRNHVGFAAVDSDKIGHVDYQPHHVAPAAAPAPATTAPAPATPPPTPPGTPTHMESK
jgi:hypothetical protein